LQNIKGLLFDKDGTLIEFHTIWVKVALDLVKELNLLLKAEDASLTDDLLQAIGFQNNQVDPKGILAGGTKLDIAEAFEAVIRQKGLPLPETLSETGLLQQWVSETLLQITRLNIDQIRPAANLTKLLDHLREQGIRVGIATADDRETTNLYLQTLQIDHYFEFVGTSDSYEKKPHPSVFQAFCSHFGLRSEEVVVVGDTVVDLHLAKNSSAGLAIGVLSGAGSQQDLEPLADLILPSIEGLVREDGRFVWQG
jgi:HAD superfamily hydrolase (TIGR01549 family)